MDQYNNTLQTKYQYKYHLQILIYYQNMSIALYRDNDVR